MEYVSTSRTTCTTGTIFKNWQCT